MAMALPRPNSRTATVFARHARGLRVEEVDLRSELGCSLGAAVFAAALIVTAMPFAEASQDGAMALELNKLEPLDKGCRAYMVIENKAATDYETFKLDLFMFRKDGVIGRRFAIDLAPLKGNKRTVKLFDLAGAPCDEIGSFLINDVLECKAGTAAASDCLARLLPTSLAPAKLSK
jgi:hypothetical protein